MIAKILVPMDFTESSDDALEYALAVADRHGAEVEILYVWPVGSGIFAETPEGIAMEETLSAAESERVSGRLEFGEEPATVILGILEQEPFDLVVLGRGRKGGNGAVRELGHVAANVTRTTHCPVVTIPSSDEEAA